ncbi:Uncharacterized protein C20orf72 [Habropoda laboriosa]|uniref:Mitochondrial genome maintenance exonuclease 1 n=2 Tax=Habropoda laboriosa TaxID=597456 RepID=A0A0L7QSV5_9HYME|nr:Uncharacterized protein C20orf72 [Habropoda laboriosa]
MKDLKSYSVFGGEVTENCGIQCIEDGRCLKIPSVTYILNETMSVKTKKALEMWKNNIIDTFDEKYFRLLCKGLLEEGKVFHKCIQNVLLKKVVPLEPRIKPVYYSVEPVLKDLQRVHSFETYVTHPTLRYSGIVDCIVSYRKQLYIIDWKRSAAQGASLAATFDAPVQLAAYIGAVNASNKHPFRIDRGLVIVAYTSGEPASVHELNDSTLQKAWEEWLRRLELFYTNLNKATN